LGKKKGSEWDKGKGKKELKWKKQERGRMETVDFSPEYYLLGTEVHLPGFMGGVGGGNLGGPSTPNYTCLD